MGGLFTNLGDQLLWESMLHKLKAPILSKDLLEKSQLPIYKTSQQAYGFGLMFGIYKGMEYSYHDGSTGAYNATFFRFSNPGLSVVLMSNNGNVPVHYLVEKTVDIILGLEVTEEYYPSGPKKVYPNVEKRDMQGTYRSDEGTIINIEERNDTLYRKIYQRDAVALIQKKESLFHYSTNNDLKLAFETKNGKVSGFTIYLSSQPPIKYSKLPSYTLETKDFKYLPGSFYNAETKTTIKISYDGDNTFLIDKNGRERNGELVYKDLIRMNSYKIELKRNGGGQVDGLKVKNGRIKNVLFIKL